MTERAREKRLSNSNGAEDDNVTVGRDEAKRAELMEYSSIEGDLRGLVPSLHHHRRIESRLIGAPCRSRATSALDLVGEDHQQEVLDRHRVFLGQRDALGQGVEDLAEAQLFHRMLKLGGDGFHWPPP